MLPARKVVYDTTTLTADERRELALMVAKDMGVTAGQLVAHRYGWHDVFPSGRYKDCSIRAIYEKDADYLCWLYVKGFEFTHAVMLKIMKNPGFCPAPGRKRSTMKTPHCPACSGPGVLLGSLGSLRHFRCRDCGIDFSRSIRPRDVFDHPMKALRHHCTGAVKRGEQTPIAELRASP